MHSESEIAGNLSEPFIIKGYKACCRIIVNRCGVAYPVTDQYETGHNLHMDIIRQKQ